MSGEIISVADMRGIDAAAAAQGAPTRALMENAGRAVAEAVAARFAPRPLIVLCGPGNNGGDGCVAARRLHEMGWPVRVETMCDRAALKGDAADAASLWRGDISALGALAYDGELLLDALFGAGLTRPLEGAAAARAHVAPPEAVIAVDVPSGIDGDSGNPIGQAHFSACLTITFVRKKPAHVLEPGRSLCGDVIVADIGVEKSILAARKINLWESGWDLWRDLYPWPQRAAYKHARGHVYVASGGAGASGAARLSARAALRVGAGLVTMLSPREAMAENAAHLTAIMLRSGDDGGAFAHAAQSAQACVIGPAFGLGAHQRACLDAALNAPSRAPLVLDADALTLLAPLQTPLGAADVLTPHVGEFNRLFPGALAAAASRIEAARAAAAKAGCVIVLKGPDTVTASPDGRAIVNTSGTPFMATAGSGDVLAGFIAGLIGQGLESFHAAALAAWLHGACGEVVGPGLIAEDLPEALLNVLNNLAPARLRRRPAASTEG